MTMAILPMSLLLLTLAILSPSPVHSTSISDKIDSIDYTKSEPGITWTDNLRTVYVLLPTPNLPLYTFHPNNQTWTIDPLTPSALVLKISVSPTNKTLLLGHETPFLPLPQPVTPPRLNVPQARADTPFSQLPLFYLPSAGNYATVGLDYDRLVHPRDDPSIRYYNHWPVLHLNILGVGFSQPSEQNVLLDAAKQQMIIVRLQDHNSPTSNPPNPNLEIKQVKVVDREKGYVHPRPPAIGECTRWSWLCEDFGDAPWYRYIWRQEFDENGRIGCARHWVVSSWAGFKERFGIAFAIGSMLLASVFVVVLFGYGVYGGLVKVQSYWRERRREVDEEEEGEGLLDEGEGDEELPPPYVEMLERPLPPLPEDSALPKYESAAEAV